MNDDLLDENAIAGSSPVFDGKTITQINDAKIEANDNLRKMVWGRWVLLGLAALNIFALFVGYTEVKENISLGQSDPNVVAGAIKVLLIMGLFIVLPYVLLALFFPKAPRLCLGLGLIFYVLALLLQLGAGGGGLSMFNGFGAKLAILVALSYPLYSGFKFYRFVDKLKALGIPRNELDQLIKLKPVPRTKRPKK